MFSIIRRYYLAFVLIVSVGSLFVRSQQVATSSPTPSNADKTSSSNQSSTRTVYESATVLKAMTRLVVVDVVATDQKDNAVTDLKGEDFTIMEDSREQRIAAFSFQQPSQYRAGLVREPEQSKLPENVFTNVPRYAPTSALNVILLDA